MHGGVAGVGGRPPPLCRSNRLAFTLSDVVRDSLLRQTDFGGAEEFSSFRDDGFKGHQLGGLEE
jgi:hypothetical protein